MGRVDGYNPHNSKKETAFTWTDVYEKEPNSSLPLGNRKFITFFLFCLFVTDFACKFFQASYWCLQKNYDSNEIVPFQVH